MNYKLKHLSKYCCKPANELEFEAVKMAAEIGGVEFMPFRLDLDWCCVILDEQCGVRYHNEKEERDFITVLDFTKKLRMTEEEAEKLEDDRVRSNPGYNWTLIDNSRTFKALGGHKWRLSDDRKEVYLVKK